MKFNMFTAIFAFLFLAFSAKSAEITVSDADIKANQTVNWTANNTYILNGFVFAEEGSKLNIQAGTVIKGKPGKGENSSALIVCRGAQIFANGTAEKPIIFTSIDDNPYVFDDLPMDATGLWGGVIVLGKSKINAPGGIGQIEGIPSTETRGAFGGGTDPKLDDNSGVIRYVSIRHGGTNIGANNEINGLTMGAVGSGTTIEYVEVFRNDDDGFEFFGGTVNTKYLISAFNNDDSFDSDMGFTGKGQFWFSIQAEDQGNNGGEHDGGVDPEDAKPYAHPMIFNATYIGSGMTSSNVKSNVMMCQDNTGGEYKNSIFTDYSGKGIAIEDLSSGEDARKRLESGDLSISNNLWFGFKAGNTWEKIAPDHFKNGKLKYAQEFVRDYFSNADHKNWIEDPMLTSISRKMDKKLDPRPKSGSSAYTKEVAMIPDGDDFLVQTDYIGAFGQSNLWAKGWTVMDGAGYLTDGQAEGKVVNIFDATIKSGDKVTWTSNNTYILNGYVFVEENAKLTIEPGTVIKGKPGKGEQASALIICRGAQIFANGTKSAPIIFTAEDDDPKVYDDLPMDATGLWGGVIVLGHSKINLPGGVGQIEGIPSTETRGAFGGGTTPKLDDNSGIIRYVSIRHGGTSIGANNEINGLTMGAVGSGTTIEYVEVFRNDDDGFEFFGGTVNTKYLISAFNNDDSFDSDMGFTGKGQYWFSIQSADQGNNGGEHDGGVDPEDAKPYAHPMIFNATYIGSGVNSGNLKSNVMMCQDNTGGEYKNSIFTDMGGKGIAIEDLNSGEDARTRLEAGDLEIKNNLWFGFKGGNELDNLAPDHFKNGKLKYKQDFVREYLGNTENNNWIEDPMLMGISRTTKGKLDPRPRAGSPALTKPRAMTNDAFFDKVDFIGAFSPTNLWINDWTMLHGSGIAEVKDDQISTQSVISTYPNPVANNSTITYTIKTDTRVEIALFDVLGNKVKDIVSDFKVVGTYYVDLNAAPLSVGTYFLKLESENGITTKQVQIQK